MNKVIKTPSNARLIFINYCKSTIEYNWLFIPGGPGLGSESLTDLVNNLNLPGTMWYFDFPGDGSNTTGKNNDFSNWQTALIEASNYFDNTILVTHSSGGMFTLATPAIEKNIIGLILMNSAPSSIWQVGFEQYLKDNITAEVLHLQELYQQTPSNDILKRLTIACSSYFSLPKTKEKILNMLETLSFNCSSHLWAEKNFDATYKAQWIPQKIPTLIFSGDQDRITPLRLFSELNEFQRKNILIREIKNASHFPWMENPETVRQLFSDYCQWLKNYPINCKSND